jgi:ammonium transporter, Amt family
MAVYLLIGCFLILMLVRVGLPFGVKPEGVGVAKVALTFREKLHMHRINMYTLALLLVLSAIGQWFPTTVEIVLIMLALGIVNLPMRYHFTTQGIACNNVLFRSWKDFSYVRVQGSRLTLVPRKGLNPLKLFVQVSRQKDILPYFQRFLPTRTETVTPWYKQLNPKRWFRGRLATILIGSLLLVGGLLLFSACGETTDPSGLNTSSQQNLTGISTNTEKGAPVAPVQAGDLDKAKTGEPLAYELAAMVDQNRIGINFVWTLVTGYLVMFMQAGFALVETGLCRAKNAGHTMSMNFMVYGLGMAGYFIAGFAFQFGGAASVAISNLGGLAALNKELSIHIGSYDWGLIGYKGFFLNDGSYDVGIAVLFLFEMVFMDTTATIPTGAMAERWKWSAFCVYALFVSTLVYPVFGNWAWGGGWLAQLKQVGLGSGYIDFAGSGVVHAVGGWCGLAGAIMLGARLGKYNRDGSANTIPGHNMVFALLGCFILAFGWFGFNPGSTLGASGNGNLRIGIIAVNTMLSGALGSITAMIYTWTIGGARRPDIGMMGNGLLAGLVAITAPSGYVSPVSACIIGGVAGVFVVFFAGVIERVLKVDDPVGAIAVHGVNGAWGQLSVGLFADGLANYGGVQATGIFYGSNGWGQLAAQAIGVVVCFVYVFGISTLFFWLYKRFFGLRVSPETELKGLDVPEMGGLGYNPDAEPYVPDEVPGGARVEGAGG